MWYSLLLLGHKPIQHVTLLNTVGNCNTMVSVVVLCYGTTVVYAVRRWPKRRYLAHDCTCSVIDNAILAVRSVINITDNRYTNTQIRQSEFIYKRTSFRSILEKCVEYCYVSVTHSYVSL